MRSSHARRLPALWWVTPVVALGAAVAVAVSAGQPRPAAPASGVSVPVRAAATSPPSASQLVVVSRGITSSYDVATDLSRPVALPGGARPVSVVGLAGAAVVIGVLPGRSTAYLIRGHRLVSLGWADTVVPTPARMGAWVVAGGLAREVDGTGRLMPGRVRVPAGYVLTGAVRAGLVVSTADSLAPGQTWLLRAGFPAASVGLGRVLAVAGGRVLIRLGIRLSVVDLSTGRSHVLPQPSAVIPSNRGALSPDGRTFAVMGRTAGRARLVVGPVDADYAQALRVLPLDGVASGAGTVSPAWISDTAIAAVRPDGRLVTYQVGDGHGWLLRDGPRRVSALAAP